MYRKILTGTGLVLGLVLFLAVNVISNAAFQSLRLDLTENRLFTLSEGTRNILESLDEPIHLRLYLSQRLAAGLPGVSSYAVRVRELLEEYSRVAGGNLRLSIIDPEPFSEEEDRAVGYGLQGVPVNDGTETFYFGLVGTGPTDEEEVIPFFQPDREEQLEYDLTQLVYRLANPEQSVVGLLTTLPLAGAPGMPLAQRQAGTDPWFIYEQLRQSFDVRTLEPSTESIPADVDVLMLVHPKELTDRTWYAIDQFVLRGGRLLAFVDPVAEADTARALGMGGVGGSDLGPLLDAWGVEYDSTKVAADLRYSKKVRYSRGARNAVVDYPLWFDVPPDFFDREDVITGRLDVLAFGTPGHLEPREEAETSFVSLVTTGPDARLYDAARVGPLLDPRELLREYRPQGQYTLVARVTGKVGTAFPEGRPAKEEVSADEEAEEDEEGQPPAQDEPAQAEHLSEATEPINVLLVADTDLLQDTFWVQVQRFLGSRIAIPSAANGSFVINALDNLSGSNDLISVRNRGTSDRPFTRLRELQQEAERRFLEKEQELQARLKQTEQNLIELQREQPGAEGLLLSPEQKAEIATFREQRVRIRKELRQVQHQLRKDIDALESRLKFINIGLVPLLIGVGGVVVGVRQIRRRTPPTRKNAE